MAIELILLALFTISIFLYLWTWRMYKLTKNIPGEKAYPLIGHAYFSLKIKSVSDAIHLLDSFVDKFSEYGITKFWFGPILFIGLFNPKYIEVIANSPYTTNKGNFYCMVAGGLVNGVFVTSGGTKWKELRKPLVKSLTKRMIESDYHQVFVKRSKVYTQFIRQHKMGVEFDLFQSTSNLFLDMFSETHLGVQTNEVVYNKFNFIENFDILFETQVISIIRFHFYFKKLGEYFSQLGKTLKRGVHEFNKFLQWVLEERKKINQNCKDSTEYYSDFLLRRAIEKKMSFKLIRQELGDVVVAGSDTSTVVASSAMVFLAMFPHVQEKAYQEQLSIFGHSKRDVTADDLESMSYLRMVIKETLRLICPPGTLRTVSEDVKLDNYILPKGAILYVCLRSVHLNIKYWEKPKEFYPEHFLPEKEAKRPSYAYVPFGVAPRACPGFTYGTNSILVILSTLLRNFEMQTSMKYENIEFKYKLLLQFNGGYNVKFIERNKI